MDIKIKKLHDDAKMPTYATDGSACFDLYAAEVVYSDYQYKIGLAFEIPENHVMLIAGRSGFAFNLGAGLVNGVGIIDSDYRGDIGVKYNKHIDAKAGDRVAQAMIIPVEHVNFEWSEELSETDRGEGGFGSTGVE